MYELKTFIEIENKINDGDLPAATLEMINKLAKLVGAPTYVKTPNFKAKTYKQRKGKTDWGLIRNFKITKIEKKIEGIEHIMNTIREFLNKITHEKYDENFKEIEIRMDSLDESNLLAIGKYIFEMASSNKFYSELYARLYKDLMNKYNPMVNICLKSFESFTTLFQDIKYVDPEENYDKFCDINEENEKRRSMGQFFVHLTKIDVLEKSSFIELVLFLQNKLLEEIKEDGKNKVCEEISENLFILIKNNDKFLKSEKKWKEIINNIKIILNLKLDKFPSLSKKIKFKHMDMI